MCKGYYKRKLETKQAAFKKLKNVQKAKILKIANFSYVFSTF